MGNGARRIGAGAVAAALLMGGCTTTGPGRPRPTPTSAAVSSTLVETRDVVLAAPAGMRLHIVDFATAAKGYALLVSDSPASAAANPEHGQFRAALFATTDGGRTWSQLRHPRPVSRDPNMFVGLDDTVMLSAWPNDWYISTDGGRTFRTERLSTVGDLPSEYLEAFEYVQGSHRLRCDQGGCVVVERRAGGRTVAVPAQPATRDMTDLRVDRGGRIWVVGLDGKRTPVVEMSPDGGRTWQRRNPPAQAARAGYSLVRFVTSPDGADLWLVASPDPGSTVAARFGRSVRLRKEIGLPHLWRLAEDSWVSRGTAASRPDQKRGELRPSSLAAVGRGHVLVASGQSVWLVDDGWTPVDLPGDPAGYLSSLRDGTIRISVDSPTHLFGTWDGQTFRWVKVTLTVRSA